MEARSWASRCHASTPRRTGESRWMWSPGVPAGWGPENSSWRTRPPSSTGSRRPGREQTKTGPPVSRETAASPQPRSASRPGHGGDRVRGEGRGVGGGDEDGRRTALRVRHPAERTGAEGGPLPRFEQQLPHRVGVERLRVAARPPGRRRPIAGAAGALLRSKIKDERLEGAALSPVDRSHPARQRRGEPHSRSLLVLEQDRPPRNRIADPDPHGGPHPRIVGPEERDPGGDPGLRRAPVRRRRPGQRDVEPAADGVEAHGGGTFGRAGNRRAGGVRDGPEPRIIRSFSGPGNVRTGARPEDHPPAGVENRCVSLSPKNETQTALWCTGETQTPLCLTFVEK